jgi:2-methylcitrate dehydratase PrpD
MRAPVVTDFVAGLRYEDIPDHALHEARRCLLDLAGVAAAGSRTKTGRLLRNFAHSNLAAPDGGVRILIDGRRASPAGAAMAGAAMIDSVDAHDGHRPTKGHAGVALLPSLAAFADGEAGLDGAEFLTRLVLGYEIAIRAGIALHASAADYHTSGAWNALGAAAIGARRHGLDHAATRHALGIAEYWGPRSPMMRVIDHPSMLKDGSAMGAFAGTVAVDLAADGFTGAPAALVELDGGELWADLGMRWCIAEQYFKPYPVCRWAQPAIRAAMALRPQFGDAAVETVRVETFHHACRLAMRAPADCDQAQYSLPFPLAAAILHGEVGMSQIDGAGLTDEAVLKLSYAIELVEDETMSARFPDQRVARVVIGLSDGRVLESDILAAAGDPEDPLSDEQLAVKFESLAGPVLGSERTVRLRELVAATGPDVLVAPLLDALLESTD